MVYLMNSLDRHFYDTLKEIYINKEMSFSPRLSVITLIHRKDSKSLLKIIDHLVLLTLITKL